MSAALLDDLLAAFIAPTPAKPANSANREDWRGLSAYSATCEGLRIVAKPQPGPAPTGADSQAFAEIRNTTNTPESKQRRGFSQVSHDSQGWTDPNALQTCAACTNRLRHGTCSEPVAAGLLTAEEGFGIVWPAPTQAATCPAFSGKTPMAAQERPYRLTPAQGDVAHADPWDDAAIARFQARVHRLVRLGFSTDDADDLSERLTLRDRDGDDRRLCLECTWLGDTGRCLAAATGRIPGADRRLEPVQSILQRCGAFGLRKGLPRRSKGKCPAIWIGRKADHRPNVASERAASPPPGV